ncbi:MAG: hypothetical protein FJ246_04665 [Nitrospira sp.]|nr:hypothetical protein [Nitrospira sp.]
MSSFETAVGVFSIIGTLVAVIGLIRSIKAQKEVRKLRAELESLQVLVQQSPGSANIVAGTFIKAGGSIVAHGKGMEDPRLS